MDALREFDMNGPKRFTSPFIRETAALFGWALTPLDAEGLVALDRASRNPGPWPEAASDG